MSESNEEVLKSYVKYINSDYTPSTPDKYIDLFRALATVTNHILDYLESSDQVSTEDHKKSLESAAQMVESIALLRGERFRLTEGIRPSLVDTNYQSEMYKVEDYFKYRLGQLGYINQQQ
ncbi:hypothetical protein KBD20_02925 [Candidatus Saccharibacteria bacterium]|nr:hypothetical protein [Candidatus Saccharibacteria bacterium]